MRSHVKLFPTPLINHLSAEQPYTPSNYPLQLAHTEHLHFKETIVSVQSISHYLVHIEFYEYRLHTPAAIDLEITSDSVFMMAMLEGCAVLYNDTCETISELRSNSCSLTYLKAGKYKHITKAGNHQLLLLNIRPSWLINKYGALKELRELISSYNDSALQIFSLPGFNIAQQLFNALLKFNAGAGGRDLDIDMHIFVNDCVSRYLVKLHHKITSTEFQGNKARAIGEYVTENFASKIVGDEPALASHFMISTTMLTRLAKLYFGKPLHQQVIELRMHIGLKLLLTTKKTVKEISIEVGYDDPKYFSRAFKKRFKISPNDIRVYVI